MDIEKNTQRSGYEKSQPQSKTDKLHPALWFEEPSETVQKLTNFYKQCNTLEYGRKLEIKEILKVSIDSRDSLLEIKQKSSISKEIEGMNVLFPMEPYQQQIEYVAHLISALNQAQNTLLEYPRGGGRTLSILAGCLGWLHQKAEQQKMSLPKVFFICRNYSRLPDVFATN